MNYLKKKSIFLLGDFNINFLNYDIYPPTNEWINLKIMGVVHFKVVLVP